MGKGMADKRKIGAWLDDGRGGKEREVEGRCGQKGEVRRGAGGNYRGEERGRGGVMRRVRRSGKAAGGTEEAERARDR